MRAVPAVIAILTSALLTAPHARAAVGHAEAALVADVTAVRPGQPFTLAVPIKVESPWHVYWVEPGNGGLPTRVKFTLPDGFKVGELRFPVPVQFKQPGGIVGYGYEGEATLLADVTPPADWPVGKDVPVRADVAWLACSAEMCVPGKRSLTLTLPTSADASPANAERFAAWRARLPVSAMDGGAGPVRRGGAAAGERTARFWGHVRLPGRPSDPQVFVAPGKATDVANITVDVADGNDVRFEFTATVLKGQQPPEKITAVLAYTDEAGHRRGIEYTFADVSALTSH